MIFQPYSRCHRSAKIDAHILSQVMSIIAVLAVLVGCSGLTSAISKDKQQPPDPAARAEIQALLSTLSSQNAGLKNFKGVGKIKVRQKSELKINERVAWVGSENSKISFVILIGGHPAVRIASDGEWFYYYEIGKGEPIYKKIAASNANLKRIISISIQTDDVLKLLAGKIPIRKHHSAVLEKQDANPGHILVLRKRWWGITEKIYFDEEKTRAYQVEFYKRSGSLIYRARFDEMQTVNGYLVPVRLSITNGDETDFVLDIRKFWTDVAVDDSMFVLNPPK